MVVVEVQEYVASARAVDSAGQRLHMYNSRNTGAAALDTCDRSAATATLMRGVAAITKRTLAYRAKSTVIEQKMRPCLGRRGSAAKCPGPESVGANWNAFCGIAALFPVAAP
jgi:hypothetical protein